MMWLVAAFTLIPILELGLLIEMGRRIGALPTIALVLATGICGAAMARFQGFLILSRMASDLSQGIIPGDSIIDGVLVLVAGVLLITPGVLTDIAGLLLLVPQVRVVVREWLKSRLRQWVSTGVVWVFRRR